MAEPVYLDSKRIGEIDEGVFVKLGVYGSKHKARSPKGWAIDAVVFEEDIVQNCHTILIPDREDGKQYKVSVKLFNERKIVLDRGYGRQYL